MTQYINVVGNEVVVNGVWTLDASNLDTLKASLATKLSVGGAEQLAIMAAQAGASSTLVKGLLIVLDRPAVRAGMAAITGVQVAPQKVASTGNSTGKNLGLVLKEFLEKTVRETGTWNDAHTLQSGTVKRADAFAYLKANGGTSEESMKNYLSYLRAGTHNTRSAEGENFAPGLPADKNKAGITVILNSEGKLWSSLDVKRAAELDAQANTIDFFGTADATPAPAESKRRSKRNVTL